MIDKTPTQCSQVQIPKIKSLVKFHAFQLGELSLWPWELNHWLVFSFNISAFGLAAIIWASFPLPHWLPKVPVHMFSSVHVQIKSFDINIYN